MSDIAISVESISKCYSIGDTSSGSLREAIAGFFSGRGSDKTEDFWALKELSFEVKKGDAIGIIGKNGAGKSTLLKVLSRITEPTTGRIEIDGRVSSLLEVGTGFHPELTGRENVFLNGTVLGMTREEIKSKFDEIVDFSGVEKFLDTPVKRYSSGMKVRLGFAVAAHLEPEILIVDEVLAVGDAEFQKKCLGKMESVSGDGRTILFVSHNMASVQNLCPRSILLSQGKMVKQGDTDDIVNLYMQANEVAAKGELAQRTDRRGTGDIKFTHIEFLDDSDNVIDYALSGKSVKFRMHYMLSPSRTSAVFKNCRASLAVLNQSNIMFLLSTELVSDQPFEIDQNGYIDFLVPNLPLSNGVYHLNPFIESNKEIQDWVQSGAKLQVEDGNFYGTGRVYPTGLAGKSVLVPFSWSSKVGAVSSR